MQQLDTDPQSYANASEDSARDAQPPDTRRTATSSPARIPSLDGLRAVSILAVLLGHVTGTAGAPAYLANRLFDVVEPAHYGVLVFFSSRAT